MNVHVKMLPSPSPQKFNTFNTFNTIAVFNRALEYPMGMGLLAATPYPGSTGRIPAPGYPLGRAGRG